ncbi:MAG: MBL fold metallo-hydrolase [Candidatus Staskawiczbacteria bacterium]|nr:MBL fold metallo-hydrolase [Candidatus Staskawiczbacteria bacterium]
MSASVKILIEGYTNANEVGETGEEKTQPTITLVRDGDTVMVVDPGIMNSQQDLIDKLAEENLTVDDVNIVCITHSHIDHYRNIGMFPNAKVLEYFGVWEKNSVENWQEQFSPDIQILRTPGHDKTDITLFVTTGPDSESPGVVAICGDVFWKENYPAEPKDDSLASNPVELGHSREMVLKMSDWIIPGHGPMYKAEKIQMPEDEGRSKIAKKEEPKPIGVCKRCHRSMNRRDRCLCRPWLCHNCCECGLDCDLCGCSHKKELQ